VMSTCKRFATVFLARQRKPSATVFLARQHPVCRLCDLSLLAKTCDGVAVSQEACEGVSV
jgi:hypothetical protein